MNIVAIETATETVGVAVRTAGGVQADFSLAGRRRHVESLVPAIEHLLAQVGLAAGDLEAVAVDVGPGLFTGLRVGVATANGLAQALGVGIVPLSSLDVLIGAARNLGHRGHVLSVVDARRHEVFAALRDIGSGPGEETEVVAATLFAPDDLATTLRELGGVPILAVGDGAQRYAEVFGAVPGVTCVMGALRAPPASALLDLALRRLAEGATPASVPDVVPLYMREADAKSNYAQFDRTAGRSAAGKT